MAEPQEPSYYEIALTHRQVLFGFVILLGCLMAAFFSGVWMGRGGEGVQVAAAEPVAQEARETASTLPEVNFFSEKETSLPANEADSNAGSTPGSETRPTANDKTPVQLSQEAKLRRRARIRQRREEEARKAARAQQVAVDDQQVAPGSTAKPPVEKVTPPEPTPARAAQPKPAAPTSAAVPTATQRFVIQVLSTRDRSKAQDVVDRLKAAGYSTLMSTFEQNSQVMHRVRVGPFSSRAEAERARNTVQSQFKLDTWVTTE